MRERGFGAGAVDPHVEAAGAVQRAAGHAVAGLLLHGDRLAGEERLIDGAASLDDGAVDRDLVAGPHAQDIADLDRGKLHRLGLAVLQHAQSGLGRKVEQRANGAAGLLAGPELEHLAEQHQRDDDRRRLEIGGDQPVRVLHGCREQPRRERRDQAVEIGRAGAERDQREHVQPARAQRGKAAHEERPAAPQHRGRGEGELQPLLGLRREERQEVARRTHASPCRARRARATAARRPRACG